MQRFNDRTRPFKHEDSGPKYLGEGPGYEWGVLVLKPGQGSRDYGRHYHEKVTETFYMLEGEITMWVEGELFTAGPGDVIAVEPHERHWLQNESNNDFRAIFIKYPFDPSDRVPF